MASGKVTIRDEVNFVKLMMERDLANHRSDRQRLDYLKMIGDYIDDVGEQILSAESPTTIGTDIKFTVGRRLSERMEKEPAPARAFDADLIGPGSHTLGEDRPEFDEDDFDLDISNLLQQAFPGAAVIDISSIDKTPISSLETISALFDMTRPPGYAGKNPVDFFGTGECLKGPDAHEWLYRHKFNHSYDHIHVYEDDHVLVLPDMDSMDNGEVLWIDDNRVRAQGELIKVMKEMFWSYSEGRRECTGS